jgi:Tfp pilus assembly protein PilF
VLALLLCLTTAEAALARPAPQRVTPPRPKPRQLPEPPRARPEPPGPDAAKTEVPKTEAARLSSLAQAQRHFDLGLQAQTEGNLKHAADAYERALKIEPNFVEALVNLARVRIEQNRLTQARALLVQARGAVPEYPDTYAVLGWLAARSGDPVEARAELEHALALDPRQVEARINLAAVLLEHGSLPRAIELLEGALSLDPDNAHASYDLALAYDRLGDAVRARHQYGLFLLRSAPGDAAREAVTARLQELNRPQAAPESLPAAREPAP